MLKRGIFRCDAQSEHGAYRHAYTGGFHHGTFYPVNGEKKQLVYTIPAYVGWIDEADAKIKEHDQKIRGTI